MGMTETAAWLDALYGHCSKDLGEIIFVSPCKRRTVFADHVGSQKDLIKAAEAIDGKAGHYLKINLMDGYAMLDRSKREKKGWYIVGNKSEVKTIISFHLDVDAGKSDKYLSRGEALEALDKMPREPSMVINSDGDTGGFHAYWLLQEPFKIERDGDRDFISELAVRWQNRLNKLAGGKLDATANIDRVLRVVGQPRCDGGMVTCHEYHDDRRYSLRDLTLPKDVRQVKKAAEVTAKRILKESLGDCRESNQPISEYIRAANITVEGLLSDAGYEPLSNDEWLRAGSESGARSLKIATKHDGINVFSGNDPNFEGCDDGSVGRFYSTEAVFVHFRHEKNWKKAARWCHEKIKNQRTRRESVA